MPPALYQNYLAPLSQGHLETVNRSLDGKVIQTISRVPVVASAVLAACDGSDGCLDGVVGNPDTCEVDPVVSRCPDGVDAPSCLTPAQVEVARASYAPPVDDRGRELYPVGLVRGSEGGWPGSRSVPTSACPVAGTSPRRCCATWPFPRDPGSSYSLCDFDPSRDAPRLRAMAMVYNADDTDLRKFEAGGRKLLVYHGWADPLITPGGRSTMCRTPGAS